MSAKYYQCYFDANENEGYENYLAFEKLVKSKNWNDLIEKYGDRLSSLLGCSSKKGSEEFYNQVERYLDIDFSLNKSDTSYCLQFDTFTSLDEFEMLKFLQSFGFERIETEVENSSGGSEQYFLGEKEIDDCKSVSWKWISPKPMQTQERITENNQEPESEELVVKEIRSDFDNLELEPIFLGPTILRIVVRVTLMILGIIFIPYLWAKVLCFIAIIYLNASFILRRRLTLSKLGFEKKDTAFSNVDITELRDIECVKETTHDKIILMLVIKNKATAPALRNTSELNDEEFKNIIKEYCSSCSIAYVALDEQP